MISADSNYWLPAEREMIEAAEREAIRETRRKNAKFMRVVKKILTVEFAVIGFEALYRLGGLVRGYNSFGGESMLIIAGLMACAFYTHYKK
jgi:hypothetical protein